MSATATVDDAYLKRIGAFGRPLSEGTTPLEKTQKNRLERERQTALREVASLSRFSPESIKGMWDYHEQYGDLSVKKLSESVAESTMPQLLRYGVSAFMFDAYAAVPTIYPDLVRVVQSGGAEELYAPLYGPELPQAIAPGQEYGDSRLMGLDVHVPNSKYGRLLSVEKELISDDQTGQIVTRSADMGERMRYVEEAQVIQAIKAGGPQGYTTAIGNLAASPGQISQPMIEAADIALQQMTDPLGNLMLVMPDTILVGPSDKFTAAVLLQSSLQPSVPGAAGQTASTASSGSTGWTMAVNPLQGLYSLKVSRFMNLTAGYQPTTGLDSTHGSWFLMETKKSAVFQDRTALAVVQEAIDSGGSFEKDVYRYRVDRRFAAAVIEARYIYRGN